MNTHSLPGALGRTASWAGLAAGCGGAGSLATLALLHKVGAPVIAAGAVTSAFAASVCKSLAGAIEAVGALLTSLVRARADAKATVIIARVRAELARAGLDPGKTPQAAEMQRALSVNPDLPTGRRPADETLIKFHVAARARGGSSEPGTGPDTPGNGPRRQKTAASKVVPLRSDP